MNLKINFALVLFIFLVASFYPFIQVSEAHETTSTSSTSGITNGVLWSYTTDKSNVRDSSIDVSGSASISKSTTTPKTFSTTMQLVTGIQNVDFFYNRYVKFVMKNGANSSYTQEKGWGLKGTIGNTTGNVDNILTALTNSFYRYDWASTYIFSFDKTKLLGQAILGLAGGPLKTYIGNIYVGSTITSSWFTTNVTVHVVTYHTVPLLDIFQQKYGEMVVPEVNITYLFDKNQTPSNLADDQVILIEDIVPIFQLVSVKTQSFNVNVNQTSITYASLTCSYNLTGSYTENTIGDQVLISDGKNFVFGWYGLESTTLNYNQTGGFTIQGSLAWNVTNEIRFTNGSLVSQDVRMPWWKSSYMTFSGIWSHKFSETGTITGKAALQSLVEAIRTRASTSAQDQLLMWANVIPSTMFGFVDTDNSGDASVRLNGSSLEILDQVMAVGLAEGVNLQQTYNYANLVQAKSYWQLGSDILTNKNSNTFKQGVQILNETWGANPTGSDFSGTTTNFNWVTPVVKNGKAIFAWNITYKSFPTTWSVTDGQTEILNHIEKMDLGYDYTLTVDPAQGQADLSNTYRNSGITNSTIKAMVSNLNFATYQRDLFLGMQKPFDSADGSQATNEGSLTSSFGSASVIDQLFGGTKQGYSLSDGTTYNSQTTVVNVITASGTSGVPDSVNVSTYSPFASGWFGRQVGLSLLKWSADNRTQNPSINWQLRENLVITSYPTWKGLGIVHDPSYSTVYTPGTNQTQTTSTKGISWNLFSTLMALPLLVYIVKGKYTKKKQ